MIFSTNNILESRNRSIYNNDIEDDYDWHDESYFSDTLQAVLDEQLVFESTLAYVEEGVVGSIAKHMAVKQIDKLKNINVKDLLMKILDWFCQMIGKLSNAFLAGLYKFINANHRINMFKKKLKNFSGSLEFTNSSNFFEFSIEDNSYSSFKIDINNQYNSLIEGLAKIKRAKNTMELEGYISSMLDESSTLELDNIRGNTLGGNRVISADDYSSALYAHFRSNKTNPSNVSKLIIPNYKYKEYCDNYFDYPKLQKKIKAESKLVESDTKSLKSLINTTATPSMFEYTTNDMQISSEAKVQFNKIIANKCKNVQDICNIYLLYYSAKLDALKDYHKLCSKVLVRAIDVIVMEEG